LWGSVDWILPAEFVEQINVEFVVVLSHKWLRTIFGDVSKFTSKKLNLINGCAFSGHLR
jgi:hypothetical protein